MTVVGEALSNLVVVFAPGGLEFLTPAKLYIDLGNELVDVPTDQVRVEHVYSDGTVEGDVLTAYNDTSSIDMIRADVPGFSRYCTGGGCAP